MNPRALLVGLAFGTYSGYNEAARYGFSLEGNVGGVISGLVGAVVLGALLTRFFPKFFPSRSKD